MEKQSKVKQLVKDIKWRINSGILKPNEKIPSENSYAISFGISRSTARKALQELINDGFIVSRKSIGYFVSLSKDKISVNPTSGQLMKKRVQKVSMSTLTEIEFGVFKKMGLSQSYIEDNFGKPIIKTYMKGNEKPFHVKIILFSKSIANLFNLENVLNGVLAVYYKNNINVKQRDEYMVIIDPSQFVRVKLNFWDKIPLPTVAGIMRDEMNNIIEIGLEFTLPKDFIKERKLNY